ncbi:MAG: NADPH-dependent F420 reductase [Phenylobacterium sp.]|jgi:predicted dinucleotide-binding enzyme
MRIAIIGTGNVGSSIARGLRGKDHRVMLGTREPGTAGAIALAGETGAEVLASRDAVAEAEIVILALPWPAAEAAVASLGSLSGKTVIDCMNPLGMVDGVLTLTVGHNTSGGEILAGWLPEAFVVKTLNQVGAELMADNSDLPHRPVMFMAGNDDDAKARVATVLEDLGFEALDAGGIERSRLLEPLAMVWINQAIFRGKGRAWALAAVNCS